MPLVPTNRPARPVVPMHDLMRKVAQKTAQQTRAQSTATHFGLVADPTILTNSSGAKKIKVYIDGNSTVPHLCRYLESYSPAQKDHVLVLAVSSRNRLHQRYVVIGALAHS